MPEKPAVVLYVNHVAACGGAEFSLLQLAGNLDRRRFSPLAALPRGPLADRLAAMEVPVSLMPSWRPRRGAPLGMAGQVCPAAALAIALTGPVGRADIVHANSLAAALAVLPAAMARRRPLLWSVRDLTVPRWAASLIGRRAACTAAVSEAVREMLNAYGIRAEVAPGGIDLEAFSPEGDGRAMRHRLGLADEQFIVGTAGQLVPWKNQALLLRAAARIPDMRVVIAGEDLFGEHPDYVRSLAELSATPELAGRASLMGFCEDMPGFMAALDVFVLPSRMEPLGRALLEAMAAGKPVVVVAEGGPAEIVEDGISGLLVPPEPEALEGALLRLAKDRELARRLGANARRRALHYGTMATTRRMEDLYDAVLCTGRPVDAGGGAACPGG